MFDNLTKYEFREMSDEAVEKSKAIISAKEHLEWNGKQSIQEMISTSEGGKDFVEKITYDLYRGRERVELVYKNFYDTQVDANYPELITDKSMGKVEVVFLKVLENENVRFGRLGAGEEKVVRFYTYATGVEITEDMIEYNQTWAISEVSLSFGEAYNMLLNHMHLSPIISGTYVTTAGGLATQKTTQNAGTPQLVAFDTTLEKTLRNALQVFPNGTKILANSFDQNTLEAALFSSMYADNTPTNLKRSIKPTDIIYYDGAEITVGDKTYTYDGVAEGFVYLIAPKRQFKEKVKHDLRLSTLDENPRRLIAGGSVGRSRRAVYAALGGKYGAIKIDIAA
jgi:hypothetical protein